MLSFVIVLRHSPLYDLVEETHFIKVMYFWVLVNTPAYLEFSTFYGPTEQDFKEIDLKTLVTICGTARASVRG